MHGWLCDQQGAKLVLPNRVGEFDHFDILAGGEDVLAGLAENARDQYPFLAAVDVCLGSRHAVTSFSCVAKNPPSLIPIRCMTRSASRGRSVAQWITERLSQISKSFASQR